MSKTQTKKALLGGQGGMLRVMGDRCLELEKLVSDCGCKGSDIFDSTANIPCQVCICLHLLFSPVFYDTNEVTCA